MNLSAPVKEWLLKALRGHGRSGRWISPMPWQAAVAYVAELLPASMPSAEVLVAWRPTLETLAASGEPGPVWPDLPTWRKRVAQELPPVVGGVPDPTARAAQIEAELAAEHVTPGTEDTPVWSHGYGPRS